MIAAADVEDVAAGLGHLERETAALRDVVDAHEIALLQSILEDEWCVAVEQPRGKDREHAGVRIGERLTSAVRVEEAERDGGDAVGAPEHDAEPFLVVLGARVDRVERRRLVLRGRERDEDRAVLVAHLPIGAPELVERAIHRGLDLPAG